MRALVQRVYWAEVEVDSAVVGQVRNGLLVYAAVTPADTPADAQAMAAKIVNLRIFTDADGKMNRTLQDVRGGILAISNFTLLADARKSRRPSFSAAAPGEQAKPIHEAFLHALRTHNVPVATGVFGAHMTVRSAADGPVNLWLDVPDLTEATKTTTQRTGE